MVEFSLKTLKEHLASRRPDQLVSDIVELVKLFDNVRDYYTARINPASEIEMLERYKALVREEFRISKTGRVKLRFSVIRKYIADFQKVTRDTTNIADLMLHVVEEGVKFMQKVGGLDEPFYNSLSSNLRRFLKYVDDWGLKGQFRARCTALARAAADAGYGFGDEVGELVEDYFP